MSGFFSIDNPVWAFIGKLADVILLNILWFICCIPIVTIGPSTTALYYVTLKLASDEEGYICRSFFRAFKTNFKQGTIIWLIMLAIGIIFYVDYSFYLKQVDLPTTVQNILYMVFFGMILIYFMVLTYVFPILSRFDNTIKNTLKNTLLISIRHLPWTILILVITFGLIFLSLTYVPVLLLLGFGLVAFINSYIFVHIFKNYMPSEPEERFEILPDLEEISEE